MKIRFHVLLLAVLFFFAVFVRADEEAEYEEPDEDEAAQPRARIVFGKRLISESNSMVAGETITVEYSLYNIGDLDANDLQVTDDEFRVQFTRETLAANDFFRYNKTHTNTFGDIHEGELASCTFTFKRGDEVVEKTTMSNSLGKFNLISKSQRQRQTNDFSQEWITFFLLEALPAFLLPLAIFYFNRAPEELPQPVRRGVKGSSKKRN
jgi:hypothetical protein